MTPTIQQFVDALRYCHSRHVCHRDLKLENTLLDGSVPPRIKLSDFGASRTFDPSENLHTKVGTFAYMSPQILASTSVGYDGQVGIVMCHTSACCMLNIVGDVSHSLAGCRRVVGRDPAGPAARGPVSL